MWVSHFPHLPLPLPNQFSLYMGWEAGSSYGAEDYLNRHTLFRR